MKCSICFSVCLMLLSGTVCAQQNLVINGTFDLEVPTGGTGGGWTALNLDSGGGWKLVGDNHVFVLNSNGSVQSDPSISQTLTGLSIGSEYQIKGEYCNFYGFNWCGDAINPSFGVEIDDSIVLELPYNAQCPSPFEAFFITTATEQTIRFSAERNGLDCDYSIDNIEVILIDIIFKDSFE